jgi:8-hydroxy-5-deazaflavin:NADPH oxidoreductase
LALATLGARFARAAVRTGHPVTLTAAKSDTARQAADEVGATPGASNADAAHNADVVVLAVPFAAVPSVAEEIRDAAAGKIVIDATNPLKADMSGLATGKRSAAEELQEQLPAAAVVKAFNTVLASNQAEPTAQGMVLDGLYAGNDSKAKGTVADWLSAIGYRPIDAGDLTAARALEPMAFLNIALNARNNWSFRTGWKLLGPTG